MARPNNSTEICNLALAHLKQAKVTNVETPETPQEVLCNEWYDISREAVLRTHPWNFAIKRRILPSTTAPAFGYDKAYNLPNDYVRLLTIGDISIDNIDLDYQIEDGQLLINSSDDSLKIRYIYNQTNVHKFDALFIKLLALELALNMAYAFSGNNATVERVNKLKEIQESIAKSIDGQERPPVRVQRSRFVEARRNLGTISKASKFITYG